MLIDVPVVRKVGNHFDDKEADRSGDIILRQEMRL